MKKTEMEGYILKNYYKLQSPSFFKFQYVFLDSEDYLADQLFIKYKVTVDFGDEYVKENSPYHVIFCKIRKRDEKKFLDALSEMYDKMLLMGYKDYQEVCDNFIRVVEKNEKETITILQKERNSLAEENMWRQSLPNAEYRYILPRIFYVSDIHLEHRVLNAECQSWEDIIYLTQRIVDDIVADSHGLLLIGGDVSSDFSLYQLFVRLLSQKRKRVVFVLGNHELWSFPGLSLDEIVEKYRTLLSEYGMTLLHNEVLYKKDGLSFRGEVKRISYEELCQLDEKEITRITGYSFPIYKNKGL